MTTEAIIYARYSHIDQGRGHSISRQLDNAKEVCSARGYSISPALTFIEKGKSAFTGANRAKGSLLANLELEIAAGLHNGRVLVVEHLDRISRQGHEEVTGFLKACSLGGVSVATNDGGAFYSAGEPINMIKVIEIILKAELAREESDKKSKRIRKSFAAKREQAAQGGEKRIASRPPSWIRRLADGKGYELIETRAAIVREAHRLCQLGHGASQIAMIFNERGYAPWRVKSRGWHESYVARMLTMRTAIGEYVSLTHGTRILDYYPPVITVEEYNLTQASRATRSMPSASGRRGTAQTNLFQNLARCAHCGGVMGMKPSRRIGYTEKRRYNSGNSGTTKVNSVASYLRCINSIRRVLNDAGERACSNRKSIRYERLEPAIVDKLMNVALHNDRYNVSEISESRIALAEKKRKLEHAIEQLENLKANLKVKVSATLITMVDEAVDEIAALTADRDALVKAMSREAGAKPSAAFLERVKATRAAMFDPDHDTRREARTMVHHSLQEIITDLRCNDQGETLVTIAEGLAAFRVNDAGEIDWQYDASADPRAVVALTTEAFAENRENVAGVLDRANRAKAA